MNTQSSFHEVRFPSDLALGATGGPVRRTEVVTLGSGREQRSTRWKNSRRQYNAGYGVKTIHDLYSIIEFFEERRGRLFGFRFKDSLDWKSSSPALVTSAFDQEIGVGDGEKTSFQLIKNYGEVETGYARKINKPVDGTVQIGIDGLQVAGVDFEFDSTTGSITFNQSAKPGLNAVITAGFEFDVPVRFDMDEITINLKNFEAGDIPSIPLMELLL